MAKSVTNEEKTYELSLSGEGISVKQTVSEAVAYRVVAVLMGGVSPSPGPAGAIVATGPSRGAAPSTSIGQSLREYIDSVEAKRNPEKILAIAKYLIENGGRNVTRSDIKGEFRAAAEPVPGNYARDFAWAVQVGWLADDRQNPGEYYVTQTGDEAIRQRFSDEIRKKTKSGMGGRRRRRRRSGTTATETK